jgi:3'(2'), 5'-bisphosphate nucleotidase
MKKLLTAQDIIYLKKLIIEAGLIAHKLQSKDIHIEIKPDNSPVTNVDKLVSEMIIDGLKKLTPDVMIISEEGNLPENGASSFWLVDPIDGTKSYIRGEDSYTVNIGLIAGGTATIGLIYRPATKLLHYTDIDGKLRIERDGIDVTNEIIRINKNILIAAVSSKGINDLTKEFIEQNNIEEIIHIPSSIKLCLIADGSVDVYPRFGETMEWDIAAGDALIRAAGGKIIDINTGQIMQYNKPGFLNKGFIAYGPV